MWSTFMFTKYVLYQKAFGVETGSSLVFMDKFPNPEQKQFMLSVSDLHKKCNSFCKMARKSKSF